MSKRQPIRKHELLCMGHVSLASITSSFMLFTVDTSTYISSFLRSFQRRPFYFLDERKDAIAKLYHERWFQAVYRSVLFSWVLSLLIYRAQLNNTGRWCVVLTPVSSSPVMVTWINSVTEYIGSPSEFCNLTCRYPAKWGKMVSHLIKSLLSMAKCNSQTDGWECSVIFRTNYRNFTSVTENTNWVAMKWSKNIVRYYFRSFYCFVFTLPLFKLGYSP